MKEDMLLLSLVMGVRVCRFVQFGLVHNGENYKQTTSGWSFALRQQVRLGLQFSNRASSLTHDGHCKASHNHKPGMIAALDEQTA